MNFFDMYFKNIFGFVKYNTIFNTKHSPSSIGTEGKASNLLDINMLNHCIWNIEDSILDTMIINNRDIYEKENVLNF